MSDKDGLYLGAALLGLGGVYLLSQSDSDISGGGLGETIREQIESVVAVPQVFSETIEKVTDFQMPDIDLSGFMPDIEIPTNSDINAASGEAGSILGNGIGGALGSAFLGGFTGLYQGAMVAGAHFVGRDDVNKGNVFSGFSESLGRIQSNVSGTITPSNVAKAVLINPYNVANIISSPLWYSPGSKYAPSNDSTLATNISSSVNGVVKASTIRNRSGSGADGSARLSAFRKATGSNMSMKAVKNTSGINVIKRTLKVAAGD